jgi:hypothetical protein
MQSSHFLFIGDDKNNRDSPRGAPGAEAYKVYVVRSCTVVTRTRSFLINTLAVYTMLRVSAGANGTGTATAEGWLQRAMLTARGLVAALFASNTGEF